MKILAVSQYYWPEPFNVSEICEELVARGHEVTMLTGLPNYPEGTIYDGYDCDDVLSQTHNGVDIIRVKNYPRKTGPISRVRNYYSFSRLASLRSKDLPDDFDAVLSFIISPVMSANPAIAYAERTGTPLLHYVIDLWPECLLAGGITKTSPVYKHYGKVSKKIYGAGDRLAVTSPLFTEYLRKLLGSDVETVFLPQFAEDDFFKEPDQAAASAVKFSNTGLNLTFAGNVGSAQSVETIVRAAARLSGEGGYTFHIVGSGSELDACKELAKSLGADNIVFHGRLPFEEMPGIYAQSDAMVATFANLPVLAFTLPRKIQSYMAAGKPVIGALAGEAKRVIEDAQCGFCCEAEDAEGLAECCRRLRGLTEDERKQLGTAGRDYCSEHFARSRFFETLESELDILRGTRHRGSKL